MKQTVQFVLQIGRHVAYGVGSFSLRATLRSVNRYCSCLLYWPCSGQCYCVFYVC